MVAMARTPPMTGPSREREACGNDPPAPGDSAGSRSPTSGRTMPMDRSPDVAGREVDVSESTVAKAIGDGTGPRLGVRDNPGADRTIGSKVARTSPAIVNRMSSRDRTRGCRRRPRPMQSTPCRGNFGLEERLLILDHFDVT